MNEAEEAANQDKELLDQRTANLEDQYSRGIIRAKEYFDGLDDIAKKSTQLQIDLNQAKFDAWDAQQEAMVPMMTDEQVKDFVKNFLSQLDALEKHKSKLQKELGTKLDTLGIKRATTPEVVGQTKAFGVAFNEYLAQATKDFQNWGLQIEMLANGIAQSLASVFEDFFFDVMKGNLKSLGDYWKSFGDMVMKVIAQIAAQQMTGIITSGIMGVGALMGGTWHQGGVVGASSAPLRIIPAGAFAKAPRFHSGLAGDETLGILQKGETIFPKGTKFGSGNVVVNIDNQTGTPVQSKDVKINFDLEKMVVGIVLKNKQQNGPLRYA